MSKMYRDQYIHLFFLTLFIFKIIFLCNFILFCITLWSSGSSETDNVDQVGLEFRDPPISACLSISPIIRPFPIVPQIA